MTPRMQIRQAAPADAPALHELRVEALASHPDAFASDAETESSRPSSSWVERISDPLTAVFVAEDASGLCGMAGIRREPRVKVRHNAVIWGVYVRPCARGAGVAGDLIQSCLAWARENGVEVVRLAVVASNAAAIRCYARAGFRVYGIDPKVILWQGKYGDELLMVREVERERDRERQ